jgi:hypothetical protein
LLYIYIHMIIIIINITIPIQLAIWRVYDVHGNIDRYWHHDIFFDAIVMSWWKMMMMIKCHCNVMM